MVNELKVFYSGDKGLMTFCNKKTVFQHYAERENVKIGLGVLVEDSIYDKGNYAFAVFKNVATVIPKSYSDINFFNNRGVPIKVEKGIYGDNVLLKETYRDRTYIRAYKEDGSVGLYESKNIKNTDYEGPNVYFNRVNDLVEVWEDITLEVVKNVTDSIKKLNCDVVLENENVKTALKGLSHNRMYKLSNGVLIADGKFESLVIWNDKEEIKMCWLGCKFDFTDVKYEEVTDEVAKNISAE